MDILQWRYVGAGIAIFQILIFFSLRRRAPGASPAMPLQILSTAFIVFGVAARVYYLSPARGEAIISDELSMARTAVGAVLANQEFYAGYTQLTQVLMLTVWYALFGISLGAARALTLFQGLATMALLYYVVKKVTNDRQLAIVSVALYAIAPQAIILSTAALEIQSAVLFGLLTCATYLRWKEKPTLLRSLGLGMTAGFGLFTYPALILAYVAYGLSLVMLYLSRYRRSSFTRLKDDLSGLRASSSLVFALAVALIIVFGVGTLHFIGIGKRAGLFYGGGYPGVSNGNFFASFVILADSLFTASKLHYVSLRHVPFLESTMVVLSLVAGVQMWRKAPSLFQRALLVSIPMAFLLCLFTGKVVGPRRIVLIQIPFYLLAAQGLLEIYRRCVLRGALVILTIAIHLIPYQTLKFHYFAQWRNEGDLWSGQRLLPDNVFFTALQGGDIFLRRAEFGGEFPERYYHALAELGRRFGVVNQTQGRVHFVDGDPNGIEGRYFSRQPPPLMPLDYCYEPRPIPASRYRGATTVYLVRKRGDRDRTPQCTSPIG